MKSIVRFSMLMLITFGTLWGTSISNWMQQRIFSYKLCPVTTKQTWVDLNKTAQLVLDLFRSDSLHMLFEGHEQQTITHLITNMSIAEIAFHLEVTASEQPVVAVCYEHGSTADSLLRMISTLQSELGLDYIVVAIDLNTLSKLHELARNEDEITILYFMQGHELGRIEGISDHETVVSWLLEITAEQTIRRNL